MKTAAIISEYNPFHFGHKYQIDKLKADGFELVIAIMSGNIVQRGELACADKYARARAAICCGVDVVAELPAPFSCASAEYFAYAGVLAAEAFGADVLSFGSECGDLSALEAHSCLQRNAEPGSGAARTELCGTEFMSNDILGIEYIRAIKKQRARIIPLTHKREGGGYLSDDCDVRYPSASAIRKLLSDRDLERISSCMPAEAFTALASSLSDFDAEGRKKTLFDMLMPKLIYTPSDRLSELAFLSGGLAQRIKKAAEHAVDLDDFYRLAATKVYTNGRIRRASLCALCEIEADAIKTPPEYLSLLGVSARGREYISSLKSEIEICTTMRQKKKYASFEYEKRFDGLYSLIRLKESGKRENYSLTPPYIHQS